MSENRSPYRTKQRQDPLAWPQRQPHPDAQAIHLGRIADALEGILEALTGIQAEYQATQTKTDHRTNEVRHNGV